MKEAAQSRRNDAKYQKFFVTVIAPLLENFELDIVSGYKYAPNYQRWAHAIDFEYMGTIGSDAGFQPFLREIEKVFGLDPTKWTLSINTRWGHKYVDTFGYCGDYVAVIGDLGYKDKTTTKDKTEPKWPGFELHIYVPWLPPCARLVENTETTTSTQRSYVC